MTANVHPLQTDCRLTRGAVDHNLLSGSTPGMAAMQARSVEAAQMTAFEDRFEAGHLDPFHAHERGQLSLSIAGVMTITVENRSFVLPPNRALWIPANAQHQTVCRNELVFQCSYIDPSFVRDPDTCRVFETTPLVRALIGEITRFGEDYEVDKRSATIIDLLFSELDQMTSFPDSVPMPEDPRLRRVCQAIIANPADPRDIDDWAAMACMARRTFTRAFNDQTGMGLATWRRQIRVMEAASRIAAGESVAKVSFDVGYENPSAFTAMFHRTLGVNPSSFSRAS